MQATVLKPWSQPLDVKIQNTSHTPEYKPQCLKQLPVVVLKYMGEIQVVYELQRFSQLSQNGFPFRFHGSGQLVMVRSGHIKQWVNGGTEWLTELHE